MDVLEAPVDLFVEHRFVLRFVEIQASLLDAFCGSHLPGVLLQSIDLLFRLVQDLEHVRLSQLLDVMGVVDELMGIHARSRHLDAAAEAVVGVALVVDERLDCLLVHAGGVVHYSEVHGQRSGHSGTVRNHEEVERVFCLKEVQSAHAEILARAAASSIAVAVAIALVFDSSHVENGASARIHVSVAISVCVHVLKEPMVDPFVNQNVQYFGIVLLTAELMNRAHDFLELSIEDLLDHRRPADAISEDIDPLRQFAVVPPPVLVQSVDHAL